MGRIILSVINDTMTDVRVKKIARFIQTQGFEVLLIGISSDQIMETAGEIKTKQLKRIFKKGPLFYLEYNIRLFFVLLFLRKVRAFWANDLDTLTANASAAFIKQKPLIYDSHELFTELPELHSRPGVQKIWQLAEKLFIRRVKYMLTVCDSIAEYYKNKYKTVSPVVVRNVPEKRKTPHADYRQKLHLPIDKKIVIYQGVINIGRGIEELIEAAQYTSGIYFVIAGAGDISGLIKDRINTLGLSEKFKLTGRLPYEKLLEYTISADLGVSLEKNMGLNYYYALPNKMFDYIQASVPILVSRLPEMEKIVNQYGVGDFIESHEPKHLAEKIEEMLQKPSGFYSEQLKRAARELTWEIESEKLIPILKQLVSPV
ncbi:MAG: glycosyltransferase [Bacteroidota bacterium]|nr:glycosyltransferase [Bacteroidota bacterium]